MSINKIFLAGLACVVCFTWGMSVGYNDARLIAQFDAQAEMQARAACGFGARLIEGEAAHVCRHVDRDGQVAVVGVQP